MSWEKESLFAKSKLFLEKAFEEDRESEFFGLYCAMSLELLSRSALANVSPTLLAEPQRDHQNLLHALNLGSDIKPKRSISTSQVLGLCKNLIPKFTEEELTISSAITGRRNEELHSGTAAFSEYPTHKWIGPFFRCCKILSEFQEESLETLLGNNAAKEAQIILDELLNKNTKEVKDLIYKHQKEFSQLSEEEQKELSSKAEALSEERSYKGHHKITCPACNCIATVKGELIGKSQVENLEDEVVVRQSVIPTEFYCTACNLKLNGYGSLQVAEVADYFTHRINYAPAEYYDLIDPYDESAIDRIRDIHGYEFTEHRPGYSEWDNE